MSKSAAVALEANFQFWREKRFPSPKPTDPNYFEYYCIIQFLKSFVIGDSQIKIGHVGESLDGGVDAFYAFIDGELVDSEMEPDLKADNPVRVVIMQMKESEGFSPVAVDKLYWFVDDLLDLPRKKADYHSTYRPELISLMRSFKDKFGLIIGQTPPLSIEIFYITKKDVTENADCKKSAARIEKKVKEYFEDAECTFEFINAQRLWKQVQLRRPKKKTLKWQQVMPTPEGHIGLVTLRDYYAFLKDDDGAIAERFFDSNVRGYWKGSPINKKIGETLATPTTEFWLLNNGITMLAESLTPTEDYLEFEIADPQIVNGLQTSRQIFNYYRDLEKSVGKGRRVLVRVIKAADKTIRDDIIKSTNSQNKMPAESLRATDAIHRKIETLFRGHDLFYDRRNGHYKDQGEPVAKIVSLVEALQAMLSVVILRPDTARGRPRDYFKDDGLYESVFGNEDKEYEPYNLNLYLKSTQILKRVEDFLEELRIEPIHRRNLIFYVAMYVVCSKLESPYAPPGQILKLDIASLTDEFLSDCYKRVHKRYEALAEKTSTEGEPDYDGLAKSPLVLKAVNTDLKRRFGKRKSKTA
jgi:hypothetical protein